MIKQTAKLEKLYFFIQENILNLYFEWLQADGGDGLHAQTRTHTHTHTHAHALTHALLLTLTLTLN